MSKYDPLRDYLLRQTLSEFKMTFREIESLVGKLPKTASSPQGWANTKGKGSPQREAWRVAGFDAFLISGSDQVRFVRCASGKRTQKDLRTSAPSKSFTTAKAALTTQELLQRGFVRSCRLKIDGEGEIVLEGRSSTGPGVYVFCLDGIAVYVGLASKSLAQRLYFYTRPGSSQRTNIRVNERIKAELKSEKALEILTASPPDSSWNGWPIISCAGLEYGLIANFELAWNIRGV